MQRADLPSFGHVQRVVIFGIFAFTLMAFAYFKKYYILPQRYHKGPHITLFTLIAAFASFFLGYWILFPFILTLIDTIIDPSTSTTAFIMIHLSFFCIMGCLLLFIVYQQNPKNMKKIWKDSSFPLSRSISSDIFLGIKTLFFAFPVSIFINVLTSLIVQMMIEETSLYHEQTAVKLLKKSMHHISALIMSIFSILIRAPLTEEFLFRGLLQSYFMSRIKISWAIMFSSLLFALFHFSSLQGLSNISLICTLFSFSCFLGFIYEKSRSLIPSITLHFIFNGISVIQILLK